MLRSFYTFIICILSLYSFAAEPTGWIKGTVTDAKNATPLTGVAVTIAGTTLGTITDIDGKYELTGVAAGAHDVVFTYLTYTTQTQHITIGSKDGILDVKMAPENTELQAQVVTSARRTNTENAVINEIKTSNSVVSGTSASQISKTLDRNAADVVKRIPGVTIQDDRFIVIRGLSDRYNSVWLNDAGTPSSESDKKAFSFDIIPAGLIDRVLIYKTPSPELPGDFAGGMVKVYTTSIADKNQLAVSVQTSAREFTTGTNFNYNAPSKTDWLGYDDGKRNIPAGIPDAISTKDQNYKTNIATWSKAFGNDWVVNTTKANPDLRFSLALSNVFKLGKVKLGNTLGVSYANTYTNFNIHRQSWDSLSRNYNYYDQQSINSVNAGIMDNVGVAIGNSKIEFKNLYNQIGQSSMTIRNAVPDSVLNPERSYKMEYGSRATYATELTGTHKNERDTRKYTWALGYTDLYKNQPDRRIIKYTKSDVGFDTVFKAQVPSQPDILNGGRYYSSLYEHTYSFNHQITQKITINKDFSFDVNAGNYIEYKSRSFKIRELGYSISPGQQAQTILKYPINSIFADSNVNGTTKFKIGEATHAYDHYDATNELIASFVSLKVPVGKHITIVGGARYEYNIQYMKAVVNLDTISSDIKTKFLLPSVNASYNFSDKSLVRVAYGKTLNRPEFRETAPIYYYDFDDLIGYYGALFPTTVSKNKPNRGDTLKVGQIQNIDVRYELYPSAGELIQIGGFYKSFKDPIQRVVLVSGGSDSKGVTFINAQNAYCYGVELDVRKNLAWADQKLHTNFLKNFTVVGNLSLTKSQLNIDTSVKTGVPGGIPRSDLQGQSPYVINAGVYYQSLENGFQGSLLYNVFGPRMYAVGTTTAGGESIGERPFRSFDLTMSKLFHKHYIINIGVQNILNSRVVFMEDANRDNKFDAKHDVDYKSYYPGRYYTIGVKIKF